MLPASARQRREAVAPAEYIDVAQKMLFAKDRNPNVIDRTAASAAGRRRCRRFRPITAK